MGSLFSRIAGASTSVLVLMAQLVPLVTELKNLHGQPISDQEKASIVQLAMTGLATVEGISGKAIADDADAQRAAQAVVDAVAAFHDIVIKKHLAATPAK